MEKKTNNNNNEKGRKSFGGLRNESKRIDYLAELLANNKNLDANEEGFLEIHKEAIYAKVNEIKNYEDNPKNLSVEVNEQVDSIEADQVKASDIVSQIDNPKDKEEGAEELEQIQKDTNQVKNEVQTEEERIIAELQEVKKNLSEKELNNLSGVEKIKIKKYSSDKKIQVSEGGNKNFEDQAKNTMDAYRVSIKGLKQMEDSLPEEENKENIQKDTTLSKENKDILDLWNKGAESIKKRTQELKEEGKTKKEIDEIIAKEWKISKESSEIDKIYSTIPKPKKIIENNKDSRNIKKFPDLSNKIEEREKGDFEKIYEILNISEQKEVDALLDNGIEDFKEQRKKLIEGGKTPDEASVITYQEWLKTEDGKRYQEILNNAEKRITQSGTPDNIYNRDLDIKTQTSILNDLTNQEIEIKDKYFNIKEKLEKNEGLTDQEKKELETELAKYEQLRQEINDKIGKQTEKVNELKEKKEAEDKEKIIPIIEKNDKVLTELQKQQVEKINTFLNEKKEAKPGFFKKGIDWWNNLDQSRGGKIAKTVMSAGFIGTALYFAGDKLDMLPKNQTVAQKIGSRTFLAGLSSALITSNFTKNTLGSIKEKWSKLGTTGKIVAGTALGVGGAGAFVYFAGLTTVGITIGAVGTKLGLNKVLFDKKIENLKTEKEKSEKRIEELNAKIKSFENDPTFDVEAFMKELPAVQTELDKYNNKLRNWKIGKSLTSGAISIFSGLGSMAASHLEVNDKAREFIDNGIKKTGGIFKNLSEKIKNIDFKNDLKQAGKDLDKDIDTPTGGVKGAGGGGNEMIDKDQNKFDVKNIKPEAIIDGQSRVGITYTFRDQLCADEELAKRLNIDSSKLNDPSYVAKVTKEIAIKTGYMDNAGHEIRVNKEGIGKIAYVLGVDAEGRIEVKEVDTKTGEILETHCEGDTFESTGKDKYEYEKLQKTYSKIDEAYGKNNITKPDGVVSSNGDPFSNSYLNGDDDSSYLENNYSEITKPEEVLDNKTVSSENVVRIYKFEDIKTSPDWENLKGNNLKDFFATGKINMSEEEVRVAESLRAFYKQALESSNNDEDFQDFVRNNPKLTIGEATALYKDVIEDGDFADDLKEKYHFYDWKDSLSRVEVKSETMKEMEKIAKDNFKGKFSQSELKSVNRFYEKNLSLIIKEDRDAWYEYKDQSASDYLKTYKDDHDDFTNFLRDLKNVTGLKPNNGFLGLGHKEQIDEYIMRATMKAKLDGRLDEINLFKKTTIIEENENDAENYEDYGPYDPSKNKGEMIYIDKINY